MPTHTDESESIIPYKCSHTFSVYVYFYPIFYYIRYTHIVHAVASNTSVENVTLNFFFDFNILKPTEGNATITLVTYAIKFCEFNSTYMQTI